jgi:hypothetical protein
MGTGASLERKKFNRDPVNSEAENDLSSTAYQNLLRLTILDNIRLEFQRPTTILLYGCPYGCLDTTAEFLAKKLQFGSVKCELNQSLESDPREVLEGTQKFGIIFQNYPQTFEQALSLQALKIVSNLVVIFLNCSYAVDSNNTHTLSSFLVEGHQNGTNGVDSPSQWTKVSCH